MFNPVSTYRIQFNKDFTFSDFLKNADYFSWLGISSIYASPVFAATPGSMHGYDVTNPELINPEIGTLEEFRVISDLLIKKNIGWIQDIVPNHMAFHNNNLWLMDVLEKGDESEYYSFFDIDFSHPEFKGKIMIPFLGKTLNDALKENELKAEWLDGRLVFRYFSSWFPFSIRSLREIIIMNSSKLPREFPELNAEVGDEWDSRLKDLIAEHYSKSSGFRKIIKDQLEIINSDTKVAQHFLNLQNYVLCYWKDSLSMLNYRRFFTVNSLICLRMENDVVFDKYHSFIRDLVKEKRFSGLRIDHVDGLQKPVRYLEKLRLLAGNETYIVTEKILGLEEELPLHLQVQGTSGYDYLGMVNNLFTRTENYPRLERFYKEISGIDDDPENLIYNRKKFILTSNMNGEWENLTRMFDESGFITYTSGISRESIKEAIGEFLVLFPVYKIYGDTFPLQDEEIRIIKGVFRKALEKNPHLENSLSVLQDIFLRTEDFDENLKEKALDFFLRCLQFTGPLMAKGVEDTVMYYYNCFICHNEVGDHPSSKGISIQKFHNLMESRRRNWPMAMNATSTHDTKRGEDARARLNIISELPDEWTKDVKDWMNINSVFRQTVKGRPAPDRNEEYFIYQTLAGAFPFNGKADDEFLSRMDQYLEKALREGKVNSDWNDPNEEHENAVKGFTRSILKKGSSFLKRFLPFQKKISSFGMINSLSQLFLKVACPGVPDFYQGTELWDLSLVDPDNRRPVDYFQRKKLLTDLEQSFRTDPENFYKSLIRHFEDGQIKLWLTHVLLEERKAHPDLFLHGSYIPLKTEGKYSNHVLAFARLHNNSWFVTVIPLFITSIDPVKRIAGNVRWGDTAVVLPESAPGKWHSSLTQDELALNGRILLSGILRFPLPVFLKGGRAVPLRFAGVLAHISSFPGNYGSGDLGEEAYKFADRMQLNGQTYWQILPFNPIGDGYGWSPYSSTSAFAGNTIFISPDMLIKSGLIREDTLSKAVFSDSSGADFRRAEDFRSLISDEAFTNFFCQDRPFRHADFEQFCKNQEFWLEDFALFKILKREYGNLSWNKWPVKSRNRSGKLIKELSVNFESDLKKEKFMQYLFNIQWLALKSYCNNKGIKLIGDMSFYVNYDSAEVWSHPEYFKLDPDKKPLMVAGVPPDYFSETGQLWNMPVYDWSRMKRDGYSWWINRIRRNMELCDLLRFDHFRAFSEYWEIPFGEKTAINGKWTKGPGNEFFDTVKKEFPDMPFIAEDLGSIDEKVYRLRDAYNLPGMAILQFAFGENMAVSGYIPHNLISNCIIYTGTHDNNTIKGWYLNELEEKYRREAAEYAGHKIGEETCHEDFIRMAYSSVARIAIIPVQDMLGLGESSRLNKPSTTGNNWTWKMRRGDMEKIFSQKISRMVRLYGRG